VKTGKKTNTAYVLPAIILASVIYLAFKCGAAFADHAAAGANPVMKINMFLEGLEAEINDRPFDFAWNDYIRKYLIWGCSVWLIGTVYYFTGRRKYIAGKEHGTAEWASRKDIADLFSENVAKSVMKRAKKDRGRPFAKQNRDRINSIKAKYAISDALFTATERICIHNKKLNNNTLIIGGSGSGKTRGFVMPNILQAHSSFVITDPKGEILEKSGYFLSEVKKYKIRVLNLDNKAKSDGYNPFVYIHPERPGYEERVLSLIETIIINTDGGEKKGGADPFWDKAERLFLQAIFFFTCDGFAEEEQNINTVLTLIGMLRIGEEKDNYNSDLDIFADVFEGERGKEHIGVQQYREFRQKASGKTAKSIVISAVARLSPFRTPSIRRIFSYDSMALDRVGEELTAVFVVVPPTDTTFNFIAGMLFTQLFQELQYCATETHKRNGRRLPVPVRFILDEFANTCTIPQFVKILAYARSFGVGIVPILQSLEQIKNLYKDEWGVIVDNCNTLLFLGGISHMDTLEYISKLLGKGTFDKRTTGRSRGKQGSGSMNWDVIGRELMDSSEIRKLPKENCLLIVGGRNPFYSRKYDYASHPNYRYTSDGNAAYSFEYTPAPPAWAREKAAASDFVRNTEIPADIQTVYDFLHENAEYLSPVSDELIG
jgi:type IV secretion system protein VirD4